MQRVNRDDCRSAMIIAAMITFGIVFPGCTLNKGNEGRSGGIQASKDLSVFVSQYVPDQAPFRLLDSVSIDVEEAWLERLWYQSGSVFETVGGVREGSFRFYIKIPQEKFDALERALGKLGRDWRIRSGNDGDYFTRTWDKLPSLCLYGLHMDSTSRSVTLSLLIRNRSVKRSDSPGAFEEKGIMKFTRGL